MSDFDYLGWQSDLRTRRTWHPTAGQLTALWFIFLILIAVAGWAIDHLTPLLSFF